MLSDKWLVIGHNFICMLLQQLMLSCSFFYHYALQRVVAQVFDDLTRIVAVLRAASCAPIVHDICFHARIMRFDITSEKLGNCWTLRMKK